MSSKIQIMVFGLICMWTALSNASEKVGNLAAVKGKVLLDGKPGKNGMPLTAKSVVVTKSGTCTLLFGSDVVVHLDKNSNFSVENYNAQPGKTEMGMKLKFGRLRALAASRKDKEKNIQIKTRTAVMGIRGTHVYIDSPANPNLPLNFLTIEGVAEVNLNGPLTSDTSNPIADNKSQSSSPETSETASNESSKKEGTKEGAGSTTASNKGPSGETPAGENRAPGGAPPPPPPGGGSITLAANQMLQGGGEMKSIDPTTAMNFANSVAPPPPPIQNAGDFKGTVSGNPPPPPLGTAPPGSLPPMGDALDQFNPTLPPPIPLDPIADGSQFVPVKITIQ